MRLLHEVRPPSNAPKLYKKHYDRMIGGPIEWRLGEYYRALEARSYYSSELAVYS